MIKVLKFGGTSLGSAERVKTVANIVKEAFEQASPIVVVVSAVGGVTDKLLDCAKTAEKDSNAAQSKIEIIRQRHFEVFLDELKDLNTLEIVTKHFTELQDILKGVSLVRECSLRTNDFVLSFGERLCAQLLTALLKRQNVDAEYVDARDVVVTDNKHGGARVLIPVSFERIQKRIQAPRIYIVTGFIGSSEDGVTTTLGRGGSDYTAALIGAALDADQIEIWTDVDGFMSADPRMVKEAFVLPHVSYEEAMEMSYFGAKVIHPQTLGPAIQKNIPVLIKNTFAPENPGTIISPEAGDFEHPVKGIASFDGMSLINTQGPGMVGVPGVAGRLFGALAHRNISIILISQGSSEHSICFVVKTEEAQSACTAIKEEFEAEIISGKIDKIEQTDNLTIIAAVGENMHGTPGIAGKLFGALGENSINIIVIAQGSSERNVSLVINSNDAVKAVNVIHSAFYLSHRLVNLFIVGTGSIGSTLLKQIKERQQELVEKNGLLINICGLANSKKMVIDESGIGLDNWRQRLNKDGQPFGTDELLTEIKKQKLINTILVDATASDEIACRYSDFLSAGIHIVTPNKRANTMEHAYYDQLMALTKEHRLHYFYEATVAAGLPLISTIKNLQNSGDEIIRIEGILSGTLSYIFNTLSEHKTFSQAVRDAHKQGFTEPDPRDDLSGMDVARKLLILAREIGLRKELEDVQVQSLLPDKLMVGDLDEFWQNLPKIDAQFEAQRIKAAEKCMTIRYIAELDEKICRVAVKEVDQNHALAQSGATDNNIQITSKRYFDSPLTIQGPGAGREVTAGGVFADIISLGFHLS